MNILFGKKALLDNIDNDNVVNVDLHKNNKELISLLKSKNIDFKVHYDDVYFNRFDKNLNHQGVVVHLQESEKANTIETFLKQIKDKSIVLVIDSIQDPQNFGAILRTCDAFGVDAVIYKKDNQVQINDFVIKSSMGAINYLNLIKVTNLARTLEQLKQAGY
jgi:23S rRNA (guanosine2251-2'-O)-methyltransferase